MIFPFVMQENINDCALACIAMVYQTFFKTRITLNQLKQHCKLNTIKGINLYDLIQLAKQFQIKLAPYRLEFQQFLQISSDNPLIIQTLNPDNQFHFVICYRLKKNYCLIADPSGQNIRKIPNTELNKKFTGIVIFSEKIILPSNSFNHKQKQKVINLRKIPYFWMYFWNILISNCFLITLFFLAQVFYKNFINQLIIHQNIDFVLLLLISFLVLNLFHSILNFILEKINQFFYYHVLDILLTNFYQHWFALMPQVASQYRNSYYLQLHQDLANITVVVSNNVLELIVNFITFSIASYFLIAISFYLWCFVLITGGFNLLLSFLFMYYQKPKIIKSTNAKMRLHNEIISLHHNFEDLYFRNLLNCATNNLLNSHNKSRKWAINLQNLTNKTNFFHNFFRHICNFGLMYLLVLYIFKQQLPFSQLLFINSITIYLFSFFYQFGSFCYFYPEAQKSWQRLNVFFHLPLKTKNKSNMLPSTIESIELINCDWKFINLNIFQKMNLKISGHQLLLGANGAGKTTLLGIIARKYQLDSGLILVNNQKFQTINDELWQKQCVYLSSKSQLLTGSILDNLFSFVINEQKWKQFKQLKIDEILTIFNLTIDYQYNLQTNNLSQGQIQVVTFLSLFFHEWKVLLLDEVLSNVISPIKIKLVQLLRKSFPNAIIILTTHDKELQWTFSKIIDIHQLKSHEI